MMTELNYNAGVAVMRNIKRATGLAGGICALTLAFSGSALAQFGGYPTQTPQETAAQRDRDENADKRRDNDDRPTRLVVDQSDRSKDGYRTIQAAVDDVAEGGVVIVMPGEYNENINLNKAVTLQGDRGPGMRVRVAPVDGSKPCLSYNPDTDSDHALISNIEFTTVEMAPATASGSTANRATANAYAKTANSTGFSSPPCVQVMGGVFTMKESTVSGIVDQFNANYSGASLYEYARNDIAESYYSREWVDTRHYYNGVMVDIAGGIATLEKNIVRGGMEGVRVSQQYSYRNGTFLVDNIISENSLHGVHLVGMSGVQAAANFIDGNGIGIAYNGEGEATVVGNKIQNSVTDGMYLGERARHITMSENYIASNRANGVKIIRANGFIREDNTFVNNGWGGENFFDVNTLDAGYNNVPKIDNSIAVNAKSQLQRRR